MLRNIARAVCKSRASGSALRSAASPLPPLSPWSQLPAAAPTPMSALGSRRMLANVSSDESDRIVADLSTEGKKKLNFDNNFAKYKNKMSGDTNFGMNHKVGFILGPSRRTGVKKVILQLREIKKKLVHWESFKPSDDELRATQREIDNMIDSLKKNEEEHSKIQEDLEDMRKQLEGEIERRKALNTEVVGLKEEVVGLKEEVVGLNEEVVGLQEKVVRLQEKVVGLQEEVVGLQEKVVRLQEEVVGLQEKVFELEGKITDICRKNFELEGKITDICRERNLELQLMQLGQLALSYQYNAAKYVEGCDTGRFMFAVTHKQLRQNSSKVHEKAGRFTEIESKFLGSRFSTTEDINTGVKVIRELGTNMGNGTVPNYEDLKSSIQECLRSGKIDNDVGADAYLLLDVVKFLTEKNGSSNLLASKSY